MIIFMWSGPRNLSTALMRSFENRNDTKVIDEPFYAYYLKKTQLNHPMTEFINQISSNKRWKKHSNDMELKNNSSREQTKSMHHFH